VGVYIKGEKGLMDNKRIKRDYLSADKVCGILLKEGLIDVRQRDEIFKKKDRLKKRLEEYQRIRYVAGGSKRIRPPVDIIDIISAMELERADEPGKILDEETILQALSKAWNVGYKKIDPLKLDLELVTGKIPEGFALKNLILPIEEKDGTLIVATPYPLDIEILQDISKVTQQRVSPVLSSKEDILKVINEFYGFRRSILKAEQQFSIPSVDLGNLEQLSKGEISSDDHHIVNAVNHLFSYALDQRASDIHIEPKRDISVVRFRIDGVLHKVFELPKSIHSAIVSRIKNLSRMDMTEKRRPQDGRIKLQRDSDSVEIRVSSVPVAFGEKIVMRILDPQILFQDLDSLGFTHMDLLRYRQIIHMRHGIVLVCGPTGSGKSTTLYSTLTYLSSPEINIVTVEDPIEMVHEDFNQIGVQPSVGITFGSILRNILRQDPDIIMIGEMRDLETAENAIQAALTGHLVFSTLHTNDAVSAITRLLDLGLPAFLIKATLIGVVAQRLVRKICRFCKERFTMDSEELRELGIDIKRDGKMTLYRGKGCIRCRGTGYLGRSGVFEILTVTDRLRSLIRDQFDTDSARKVAIEEGMVTLRENAVRKLIEGITTYEEVLRVTWEEIHEVES